MQAMQQYHGIKPPRNRHHEALPGAAKPVPKDSGLHLVQEITHLQTLRKNPGLRKTEFSCPPTFDGR
jgi:hypothetical protein